ncbi:MAG TPA: hypothetical protein VJI52_02985 [Candidatus Nanoarchaeia archaeon]|nr:hypothetical protein [Candidatus Nanoarchaeia archaeon]
MLQLFKPKSKDIDILPPPPPFPTLDFEEEPKGISKPVEFDKLKQDFSQNVTEFHELLDGLDKSHPKNKKISAKQKKLSKKELKRLRKLKQKKEAKSLKKSEEKHVEDIDHVEKLWLQDFDDFQDLGIDNLGLEMGNDLKKPKKGKSSKKENEIKFPDTLDELDVDYVKPVPEAKTSQSQKPKEIEDAKKEIQSAIESIRKQEKQSFFGRLFSARPKSGDYEQNTRIEIKQNAVQEDDISRIQKSISDARDALMNSNLEAAKRKYIEAMQIYNQIKPEEQAKVYNDIKNLYSERKNAEEMKV